MSRMIAPGEPVPWFRARALDGAPDYAFHTAAGRWIVLLLLGSGASEGPQAALRLLAGNRDLFDDDRAAFFGVTVDPADVETGRIAQQLPGVRWFLDFDGAVSAQFGAVRSADDALSMAPHWLLVDPMLRVRAGARIGDGEQILAELRRVIAEPPPAMTAPVLTVPGVLPPEMCRHLIDLYERNGGQDSGFMREENGITVSRLDHNHKRRADYTLEDEALIATLKGRLARVLRPMVQRAFQFDANRIERWMVACYDGEVQGHFRPHRDNTTRGTAHRKFACTINLNADEYEGGDLCFPEFGPATHRAPTGGAVVFSCSLLHEARPVTRGKRYAFLPFLYDDAGARLREQNLPFVSPELQTYRSGLPPVERDQGA